MSEVWNHFFMASNGLSVTCNHCGKFMKRSDSSTKSMWGHLKAFHADLVGEETFRLKRTRRIRGEGGGSGGKAKKAGGTKKGGGRMMRKRKEEETMTSSSSASSSTSSSSSSSSSGGEELEMGSECTSRASSRGLENNNPHEGVEEMKRTEADEAEEKKTDEKKDEEEMETPTQPYVKRKRPQQQSEQQHQLPKSEQHDHSAELSPATPPATTVSSTGCATTVVSSSPPPVTVATITGMPPVTVAATTTVKSPSPTPLVGASGAPSAFSKYSTAALLGDAMAHSGRTQSPAHGAEAPKQQSPLAAQQSPKTTTQHSLGQLPAPRPKYGLEAITGLNATQLAMLGVADPAMLANLEAAAVMNQLMGQYQQQKGLMAATTKPMTVENPNPVHPPTQPPSKVAAQPIVNRHPQNGVHQPQQAMVTTNQPAVAASVQQQQLNELLALYAASAAAASALQQQQKIAGGDVAQQQQQLAAQQQQAAAAASWLYNWEWMMGARNGGVAAQKVAGSTGGATNGQTRHNLQQHNNNAAMNALMLSALSLGGYGTGKGAENGKGQGKMKNGHNNVNMMVAAQQQPMKTEQGGGQQHNNNHQAHKRKSPVEEREECAAASLLVLADSAEAAPQQRGAGGASPPKSRKMEQGQKQQQENNPVHGQGWTASANEAAAMAESLVLYGMHRIAMELQLSYSVHANRAGKAEYAFYCTGGGAAAQQANIQRMVTLTESADQQVLHIREYAHGAVVAEECWPKSAEPGTLLLSLRDKCQRRLCAAQ